MLCPGLLRVWRIHAGGMVNGIPKLLDGPLLIHAGKYLFGPIAARRGNNRPLNFVFIENPLKGLFGARFRVHALAQALGINAKESIGIVGFDTDIRCAGLGILFNWRIFPCRNIGERILMGILIAKPAGLIVKIAQQHISRPGAICLFQHHAGEFGVFNRCI